MMYNYPEKGIILKIIPDNWMKKSTRPNITLTKLINIFFVYKILLTYLSCIITDKFDFPHFWSSVSWIPDTFGILLLSHVKYHMDIYSLQQYW